MASKKTEEQKIQRSMITTPYALVKGDARKKLKGLEDGFASMIVVDPPHNANDESRKIGTTTRMKKWFPTMKMQSFVAIFEELFRLLDSGGHMYVFADKNTSPEFRQMCIDAGFEFGNELVWDKVSMSTGYNWRGRTERILFFKKGKRARQLKDKTANATDLHSFPAIRSDDAYPTQKPVALLERLISNSTEEGDMILDPFCGSGSTGLAAMNLRRQFLGIDSEDDAIELAGTALLEECTRSAEFFRSMLPAVFESEEEEEEGEEGGTEAAA